MTSYIATIDSYLDDDRSHIGLNLNHSCMFVKIPSDGQIFYYCESVIHDMTLNFIRVRLKIQTPSTTPQIGHCNEAICVEIPPPPPSKTDLG